MPNWEFRSVIFWLIALMVWLASSIVSNAQTFPLSVASGGRYLQTASGQPFLLVGENAQTIAQALPLTGASSGNSNANATFYFSTRSRQGMNATWVQAICGIYNACTSDLSETYDGLKPFSATISSCGTTTPNCWDMSTAGDSGNAAYWSRLDAVINLAAQYGILVLLMPVGSEACGSNPQWLMQVNNHNVTTGGHTNTYNYGLFLGNRYKTFPNILWYSGDDYQCNGTGGGTPAANDLPVLDVMQGIVASGDTHLQTIELAFNVSTSFDNADFISPTGPINVNGVYTVYPLYAEALHGYNQSTAPAVVLEANYEGDPSFASFEASTHTCAFPGSSARASGCMYEYAIRKQIYWAMLAGSNGGFVTGVDPIGDKGFCLSPTSDCTAGSWTNYMDSQHITEMGYWKSLFTRSGIPWWAFVPDSGHKFVTSGYGTFNGKACTSGNNSCMTADNYVAAAKASAGGNSWLVAYLGCYASNGTYGCTGSGGVTVNMAQVGSNLTAKWFDPTNGAFSVICSPTGTACGTGSQTFTPPSANSRGDPDWVLLVETAVPSSHLHGLLPAQRYFYPSGPRAVGAR